MRDTDDKPEMDIITLPDAEGNEREFALMTLVTLDEGTFAVLAPVDQLESDDPSIDLYAYTYEEDEEGGIDLDEIEDEELLNKVFAVAEEMLFSDDEDEDEDEDSSDEASDDA
jgi:uncharacterized protein YrzB (UPF0473 family)